MWARCSLLRSGLENAHFSEKNVALFIPLAVFFGENQSESDLKSSSHFDRLIAKKELT